MSGTSRTKSIETIVLAAIMVGCGANMESRDAMVDGSTTHAATWTEVYGAMNAAHCPWCHTAVNGGVGGTRVIGGGHLDMDGPHSTYLSLVGVPAQGGLCGASGLTRVVPGRPDLSLLYLKVAPGVAAPCGATMTAFQVGTMPGMWSQHEVDMVESWIAAGAIEN